MKLTAQIEHCRIPTYPVGEPEKNPVFFEKRVYQGSCGKTYPVPFIDKVFDAPVNVRYRRAVLENDFVRLEMLPEIGGRIFAGLDKTNGYDFFYRQNAVKPALVGLAGPWISGGVEFNWPQHHRPGTFMPADVHIERERNGVATVWMSEHDPINRLKGMHGVRMRPDSSLIELRVRLYNRTAFPQTFLWWANVAAEVNDSYQAFFPEDVTYVADHAVRAISSFPIAQNPYYGIDYRNRPGANDLGWYKNIPVPTSYMVCQSAFDFFGGYDFSKNGGFVHIANRHIAPGKKLWTWGTQKFGRTWDAELCDEARPYVELMAGVYTDNQPDFSHLLPYETKTFSQFWWPIQNIGPVQQANERAALALSVREDRAIALGLCVPEACETALSVWNDGALLGRFSVSLKPGQSWRDDSLRFVGENPSALLAELRDRDGGLLLSYRPVNRAQIVQTRRQAAEPPSPADVPRADECFLAGEHLELYRHPTRDPEDYWREALARDPGDARCNVALGKRALARGEFSCARDHFARAVSRLTWLHPNPSTGEAHYHLGLSLRWLGDIEGAFATFYKATWNYEWRACAHYQLACIESLRGDCQSALAHLDAALDTNRQSNKTLSLKAVMLRKLGRAGEAAAALKALLQADPLDHWAAYLKTGRIPPTSRNDAQTVLDLAYDFCEAGCFAEALALIEAHHATKVTPVAVPNPSQRSPMTHYVRAWLKLRLGAPDADRALAQARAQSPDYFFPSRLNDYAVLESLAHHQGGIDPLAAYALGNFLFDKRRRNEAMRVWLEAADLWRQAAPAQRVFPQLYRNLAVAFWNQNRDGTRAAVFYACAQSLGPEDSRLISESDQLAQKRNRPVAERLAFLEAHRALVLRRDDAAVSYCALLNLSGKPGEALALLETRRFHPWEGGEGAVLRQFTAAHLLLGQKALLETCDPAEALAHFSAATDTPPNLGEAYHPLQAKADIHYWTGRALRALGRDDEAAAAFARSADESGDFNEMALAVYSPLSFFKGLSLRALGLEEEAKSLFESLRAFAEARLKETAKIDYFATSLPNLLVFDEDLQARRDAEAHLLIALACAGANQPQESLRHLALHDAFCCDNSLSAQLKYALSTPGFLN